VFSIFLNNINLLRNYKTNFLLFHSVGLISNTNISLLIYKCDLQSIIFISIFFPSIIYDILNFPLLVVNSFVFIF